MVQTHTQNHPRVFSWDMPVSSFFIRSGEKMRSGFSSLKRGFTLIEIVLVLSLVAILAAAAVPAINGIREEAAAREPINQLAKLAKETRLRAMQDKRPYQIAFTSNAFTVTRYLSPYLQAAELARFLENPLPQPTITAPFADTTTVVPTDPSAPPPTSGSTATAMTATTFTDWTKTYELPSGTQYRVQFWHESTPTDIGGDLVKLWVFQPTGIVVPLTITLTQNNLTYIASFNPLTGDIDRLQQP